MREAEVADDPAADAPADGQQGPLKKARKELVDHIDRIIEVTVTDSDGQQHTMLTLSSAFSRNKLQVEATAENMSALLKAPNVEPRPDFVPDIDSAVVRWMKCRSAVAVDWYDKKNGQWRLKSMRVAEGPDFQQRVDKMVQVIEAFREQHHTDPNNEQLDPNKGIVGAE